MNDRLDWVEPGKSRFVAYAEPDANGNIGHYEIPAMLVPPRFVRTITLNPDGA